MAYETNPIEFFKNQSGSGKIISALSGGIIPVGGALAGIVGNAASAVKKSWDESRAKQENTPFEQVYAERQNSNLKPLAVITPDPGNRWLGESATGGIKPVNKTAMPPLLGIQGKSNGAKAEEQLANWKPNSKKFKPTSVSEKVAKDPTKAAKPQAQAVSNVGQPVQPTVTWDEPKAPVQSALPDVNYGSMIDDNGVERRIYTPDMGVKSGYYMGQNPNIVTGQGITKVEPYQDTLWGASNPALQGVPTGRSAYFAQQEATPGSQKEWEQNQASNQFLDSMTKKFMDAGLGEATAQVAANRMLNQNREIAVNEGTLGLKREMLPYDKALTTSLVGGHVIDTRTKEAALPFIPEEKRTDIDYKKSGIEQNKNVVESERELRPLNKKLIDAHVKKYLKEGDLDGAKKLLYRAQALSALMTDKNAGNTGLVEQNKTIQQWKKMAGEARALGDTAAADEYDAYAKNASALPSYLFSNKGSKSNAIVED